MTQHIHSFEEAVRILSDDCSSPPAHAFITRSGKHWDITFGSLRYTLSDEVFRELAREACITAHHACHDAFVVTRECSTVAKRIHAHA